MLKRVKKNYFILVGILVIFSFGVYAEQDIKITTLETNVLAGEAQVSGISIEVPDYLFLGNVSVGELSKNVTSIVIKNTGDVKPIKVIAELVSLNDRIYKNLQISNLSKTSGFKPIGEFVTSVNSQKTIYARIDLRDFTTDLENDVLNYRTDLRFIAMEA